MVVVDARSRRARRPVTSRHRRSLDGAAAVVLHGRLRAAAPEAASRHLQTPQPSRGLSVPRPVAAVAGGRGRGRPNGPEDPILLDDAGMPERHRYLEIDERHEGQRKDVEDEEVDHDVRSRDDAAVQDHDAVDVIRDWIGRIRLDADRVVDEQEGDGVPDADQPDADGDAGSDGAVADEPPVEDRVDDGDVAFDRYDGQDDHRARVIQALHEVEQLAHYLKFI